ncbi:precorrin-6y C5,15-methyltransferase (decarboxylating) subunit CbiE [Flammeovirga kamogawensis]|uniref:Precorrin-6y C5,15-methyltransferase (Decarboxylating) subunit CbiE n=1 Tax=Flammeovirga kamogawensis TaxID=373891 RepID=A0ABX8H2L1_9BACT|nr:precorrin-6y C5,15-methyltransferase (decarboxylating) subunit CbiE [Flammeovirga kamogawensis]MBB6460340.1 precorrin-6Y C5,15-methyltransferase (decarboxylating) [Flammeovirga kamogawensis]QWG10149.1 precorrin-6y C5,15-methyltransferase (decarboxylating) subunit CbiE [Flammeovirga kamogawensis]
MNASPLHIDLIGIGNKTNSELSSEYRLLIQKHRLFSGGKRHYDLVKHLLPKQHEWIDIAGKMPDLMNKYMEADQKRIVVFASGDPLFFGFANTVKRLLPQASICVYPYFNALQLLAHKAVLNYSNLCTISLHGRNTWKPLDKCLINGEERIGILTDNTHSPRHIAERLRLYNFLDYELLIGEELEGKNEKIRQLSIEETLLINDFQKLNCVILIKKSERKVPLSFSDSSFQTLEGRPGMITKQAIRSITIPSLELHNKKCFWDIGSCTGAIAIETQLSYPSLNVFAFEIRQECDQIIANNTYTHQCPGIHIEINDFMKLDLDEFQKPDAIFIGGHGNRLAEMMGKIDYVLDKGGIVVMNTILEKSFNTFIKCATDLNYQLLPPLKISLNEHNTVHVLVAKK